MLVGAWPGLGADVDDGLPPGAERVWLARPAADVVGAKLAGRGVAELPETAVLCPAGEVIWEVARDETDELGLRHTFYRQVLVPSPTLARVLGGVEAPRAVPVLGSEVGVHSENGQIYLIFGYQYPTFEIGWQPVIGTARAAYELAQQELARREGFDLAPWAMWRSERTDQHVQRTRLAARAVDGKTFRLVWQVPTEDAAELPYLAELDAASGEVVQLEPGWSSGTCTPSSNTQVSAVGKAQNPSIADRSLWATVAADRGAPWTHEAHKIKVNNQMPEILVYMQTSPGETGYSCPSDPYQGIMPLQTVSGSPRYDDFTTPRAIPGRSGGDALWHTYLTFQTLKSTFGRCGPWNNCNVAAKLNIGYTLAQTDTAYYWYSGFDEGVRITSNSARSYTASAALDVVAHEWGHSVVHNGPGWGTGELNEGFADVLGYAVEWLNQPAGTGAEKADWMFFEDAPKAANPAECDPGSYNRRVDLDDGAGCYKYHKDDSPYSYDLGVYAFANMLPVALRLMSVGGYNPLVAASRCNPATMPGCNQYVSGVGVEKASKILMRILTAYASSSTQWEDLADLAMQSAWDLYKHCGLGLCPNRIYSADAEQYAAADAFTAIGYPPTQDPQECYCPPIP